MNLFDTPQQQLNPPEFPLHLSLADEQASAERQQNIRDAIHDAISIDAKMPDYFNDYATEFMASVLSILADRDDDKEGRINDLRNSYVERYCNWLMSQQDYVRDAEFELLGIDA